VNISRLSAGARHLPPKFALSPLENKGNGPLVTRPREEEKMCMGLKMEELRKAAERGDARAQLKLGTAYSLGYNFTGEHCEDVPRNAAKGVKWHRKAAEQGHAEAQHYVGNAYHTGEGVAKNTAKAVEWWTRAAEQGYAEAQYNLGCVYYHGEGVERNVDKAVEWWTKAMERGSYCAAFPLRGGPSREKK
jgi:TPR repeat protein